MDEIQATCRFRHLEVDPERLQSRVGSAQPLRRYEGVDVRIVSGGAEAQDVDVDELSQLLHEEFDVDPRTAIYLRGVFSGQDADVHGRDRIATGSAHVGLWRRCEMPGPLGWAP